jgi:hypothetical protein
MEEAAEPLFPASAEPKAALAAAKAAIGQAESQFGPITATGYRCGEVPLYWG